MSIENVNQFYHVVLQDSELQQQFQGVTDEASLVNLAVKLGQQHGYDFTPEEVTQAVALATSPTETTSIVELADEQLEAVAGGKSGALETISTVASYATPVGWAAHGL